MVSALLWFLNDSAIELCDFPVYLPVRAVSHAFVGFKLHRQMFLLINSLNRLPAIQYQRPTKQFENQRLISIGIRVAVDNRIVRIFFSHVGELRNGCECAAIKKMSTNFCKIGETKGAFMRGS